MISLLNITRKLYPKILYRSLCTDCPTKEPCESKPLMCPTDKVALVTGGVEGIGFSVAHQLLSNKAKQVGLIGLDPKLGQEVVNTLNCAHGKNRAIFFKSDISKKDDVEHIFQKVKEEMGSVDILVNSAGIWDGSNWEKEIQTNFMGTVYTNILAKTILKKPSVILNIAGVQGLMTFDPSPTLAAGYAGVITLSQSLGSQQNFEKTGIRIIALCPGVTNTEFLKDVEQRTLEPHMSEALTKYLESTHRQKTDPCGLSAIQLIKHGSTGSVWVVKGSRLFALNLPEWKCFATLSSQFI